MRFSPSRVTLHAKIKARYKTVDAEGKPIPPRRLHGGPHD